MTFRTFALATSIVVGVGLLGSSCKKSVPEGPGLGQQGQTSAGQTMAASQRTFRYPTKSGIEKSVLKRPTSFSLEPDCYAKLIAKPEQRGTNRTYADLQAGLAELMNIHDPEKRAERTAELRRDTFYHITTDETLDFLNRIKTDFSNDPSTAYILFFILFDCNTLTPTPEKENALVNAMVDLLRDPGVNNSIKISAVEPLTLLASTSEMAKYIKNVLKEVFDSTQDSELRGTVGLSMLKVGSRHFRSIAVGALGVPGEEDPYAQYRNVFYCAYLTDIQFFSRILIDHIRLHTQVKEAELERIMHEEFAIVFSPKGVVQDRVRGPNELGRAGLFFPGILDLKATENSTWVAAHELVHAFSFYLKLRAGWNGDLTSFGGTPDSIDEFVTQQLVNSAIAEYTGIPLELVPLFASGYSNMTSNACFQKLFAKIVEVSGSYDALLKTVLLGTAEETSAIYLRAIVDAYGESAVALFSRLNPSDKDGVLDITNSLGTSCESGSNPKQ